MPYRAYWRRRRGCVLFDASSSQLLGLAELRQRELRLRILADQVLARLGDAEQRDVDLEADHRLDEVVVLGEARPRRS